MKQAQTAVTCFGVRLPVLPSVALKFLSPLPYLQEHAGRLPRAAVHAQTGRGVQGGQQQQVVSGDGKVASPTQPYDTLNHAPGAHINYWRHRHPNAVDPLDMTCCAPSHRRHSLAVLLHAGADGARASAGAAAGCDALRVGGLDLQPCTVATKGPHYSAICGCPQSTRGLRMVAAKQALQAS